MIAMTPKAGWSTEGHISNGWETSTLTEAHQVGGAICALFGHEKLREAPHSGVAHDGFDRIHPAEFVLSLNMLLEEEDVPFANEGDAQERSLLSKRTA